MIVALNNKCNLTKEEFLNYQKELASLQTVVEMILCPSFLNIPLYTLTNISLGAQNVSSDTIGAHTGEVSASQLESFKVKYCIVGHSERRQNQHENNQEINKKIHNLYEAKIIPILCVGETLKERENNNYKQIITEELIEATKNLTEEEKQSLIVAYEPIWSIGTGLIPSNKEIMEVLSLIKEILPNSKILYGGSANDDNIDTLKQCSLIDGYLLGGLSLKPANLQNFLKKMTN